MPRRKRKVADVEADDEDDTVKERRRNPPRKSKVELVKVMKSSSSTLNPAAIKINQKPHTSKNMDVADINSSSESDWEEVEENSVADDDDDQEDREPVIPKEGVEFTLEASNVDEKKRKKRKGFDLDEYFRKQLRKFKKDVQESMHKVHLMCLIARGFYVNSVVNEDVVRGVALSVIPPDLLAKLSTEDAQKRSTVKNLQRVQSWCRSSVYDQITLGRGEDDVDDHAQLALSVDSLLQNLNGTSRITSAFRTVVVLAVFLRTLRFQLRIVFSLHPTPLKVAGQLDHKSTMKSKKKTEKVSDDSKIKVKTRTPKTKTKVVKRDLGLGQTTSPSSRRSSLRQNRPLNLKEETDDEDEDEVDEHKPKKIKKKAGEKAKDVRKNDEDKDFEVEFVKIDNPGPLKGIKGNRKTVSSDSEGEDLKASKAGFNHDCWLEVYVEELKQWICVDPFHEHFNEPHAIEKSTTQPITYVVAFDDDGHLKDVTRRYASGWLCQTRKLRVDSEWWEETLAPFRGPSNKRDREEDDELDKNLMDRPLPTSISEFKSHPLYALKRHLLKFEGIYPSDAVPVGFIRGEPVYPRHCIRELHSRETWLKDARLVRIGETPYKVVKARPKWNKAMGEMQSDLPLDLFGEWQTEDYVAPPAKDGKVPRNDYGNVELFKPSMLPPGTVHLQIPGLNRVARKLNIDCAQAMTGWDFHGVGSHPIFDGWIVCEEFKDILLDAWNEEQVIINEREQEKREKRIYGNWRRIIRGLLIRERLQVKYGSQPMMSSPDDLDAAAGIAKSSKRQRKK